MATSGTATFNLTVNDAIQEAMDRIGGEPVLGYDIRSAKRSLNVMFADWANRGVNQWTLEKKTLSLTSGTVTYTLDTDTVDIVDMYVTRDSTDYSVERISLTDYNTYPNKLTTGRATQFYLQKDRTPKLYIYPAPDNSTDVISYWRIRKIEDITALSSSGNEQDIDIPFRFYECMVAGLAYYMGMKRPNVDLNKLSYLKAEYETAFTRAKDADLNETFRIVPGYRSGF